jgi:hypothetical protein
MTIPIPGMFRMSSGERRINRNRSQIATQIASQEPDAVRNDTLAIWHSLRFGWAVYTELTARDKRPLPGKYSFVLEYHFWPLPTSQFGSPPV